MIFERKNLDKNISGMELTKNNIVSSRRLDPLEIQDIGVGFVPYIFYEYILDEVIWIYNDEFVEMVN